MKAHFEINERPLLRVLDFYFLFLTMLKQRHAIRKEFKVRF